MQEHNHLTLISNCKIYAIPSYFPFLHSINEDIIKILLTKKEYVIKSAINDNLFEEFINYLVKREIPIHFSYNIDQFELVSNEFGLMTNLIQVFRKNYPKSNICSLIEKKSQLKGRLKEKKEFLENKTVKYSQIIHHLFNNIGIDTRLRFLKPNKELFSACYQENINIVNLLIQKEITNGEFSFILNIEEKAATLFRNLTTKGEIYIPFSINYESEEFIITSISENSFTNSKSIKKIEFDKNSKVSLIDCFSFANSSLESITIPSSVTKIGEGAFFLCNSLQKVQFQDDSKLISIDKSAFSKSYLKEITIPRHVVQIGEKAFSNSRLKTITFSDNSELKFVKEDAFNNTNISFISFPPSVIQIGHYSLAYCKNLQEVTFSESCSIEKGAFAYSNVKSIKIPSNVELKEGWCEGLEHLNSVIIIPKETKNIRLHEDKLVLVKSDSKSDIFDTLFFACRNIKEAIIPSFIKYIASYSFGNCQLLEKVEFSNDSQLQSIGESAFSNISFENIIIPSRVKQISLYAFAYCDNLKSVKFAENSEILSIDEYSFAWTNLRSLSIPSSINHLKEGWCSGSEQLTDITVFPNKNKQNIMYFDDKFILGKYDQKSDVFDTLIFARKDIKDARIPSFIKYFDQYCFDGCGDLQSVYFDENSQLLTIDQFAFSCSSLKEIFFPPSLTKIGDGCFSYCPQLEKVAFPENSELISIEQNAFSYSKIKSLSIPSSISQISVMTTLQMNDINVFPNKNIQNITYYENKFILGKSDHKSDVFDVLFLSRRDIKDAMIPSFIKRIEEFAFDECRQLRSVTFADDIELVSIGYAAFASTSIESISIPDSVKTIEPYAFSLCSKLRYILLSSKSKLKTIGEKAFSLPSLESFYFPPNVRNTENNVYRCENLKIIELDENSELVSIDRNEFISSNAIFMIPTKLRDTFHTYDSKFINQ